MNDLGLMHYVDVQTNHQGAQAIIRCSGAAILPHEVA